MSELPGLTDSEVGHRIRLFRDGIGLSGEHLAEAVGVSQATLSRYEGGKLALRQGALVAISNELARLGQIDGHQVLLWVLGVIPVIEIRKPIMNHRGRLIPNPHKVLRGVHDTTYLSLVA